MKYILPAILMILAIYLAFVPVFWMFWFLGYIEGPIALSLLLLSTIIGIGIIIWIIRKK